MPIGFYVGFRAGQVSREPPEMPTVVRRAKRRLKDLEDKDALEAEIIEEQKIPFSVWQQSIPFVREVDMYDLPFVAVAQFLEAKLWTGDRRLMNGLRAKGFQNALSTDELLRLRTELLLE